MASKAVQKALFKEKAGEFFFFPGENPEKYNQGTLSFF